MKNHQSTDLPSIETLWVWYLELGSVRRIEEKYGFGHTRVHRALVRAGYKLHGSKFSSDEDEAIKKYYNETDEKLFSLRELADMLNRPQHTNVSRRARQLGLTDKRRVPSKSTRTKIGEVNATWHVRNPHPKGMKGKKHSIETRNRLAVTSANAWACKTDDEKAERDLKILKTKSLRGNLVNPRPKASWKAGWHEIGGKRHYFRSRWEVNYAYYLQWLLEKGEIKNWEYEAEVFWFNNIKRGTRSYLPDFRVTENAGQAVYHEVKGWMDDRSVTKLKRMKKYYPNVVVRLVDAAEYRRLSKQLTGLVPGWE